VIRIVENTNANSGMFGALQSNVMSMNAGGYDNFRTIQLKYTMTVRFEITDWMSR